MSLAILFHLLCAQHVSDINIQELATVLMNYHIGRLVFSSVCAGAFGAAGFWWCSFCRLKHKLVFHSSTIAMMHGPINIRLSYCILCIIILCILEL